MERRYSPHPGLVMAAHARAKSLAETGKGFAQWVALAKQQRKPSEPLSRAWLRTEHGLASRIGWWVASAAHQESEPDYDEPEKLVEAPYSGLQGEAAPGVRISPRLRSDRARAARERSLSHGAGRSRGHTVSWEAGAPPPGSTRDAGRPEVRERPLWQARAGVAGPS